MSDTSYIDRFAIGPATLLRQDGMAYVVGQLPGTWRTGEASGRATGYSTHAGQIHNFTSFQDRRSGDPLARLTYIQTIGRMMSPDL